MTASWPSFFIVNKNRTFEQCALVAAKFSTRTEFQKLARAEYSWLYKRDLLDKACVSMQSSYRDLSDAEIEAIARKHSSIVSFQKADFSAYKMASRRGMLERICSHMVPGNRYYTDDEIISVALKFQTRMDFFNGDTGVYKAAHRRNILDAVCAHMTLAPSGFCFDKPAFLYQFKLLTVDGLVIYKVGISTRNPLRRLKDMRINKGVKAELINQIPFTSGRDARLEEKRLHSEFSACKYKGPHVMQNGNTELFTENLLVCQAPV